MFWWQKKKKKKKKKILFGTERYKSNQILGIFGNPGKTVDFTLNAA